MMGDGDYAEAVTPLDATLPRLGIKGVGRYSNLSEGVRWQSVKYMVVNQNGAISNANPH